MAGIGDIHMIKNAADRLKGKSDAEIVEEVRKLKMLMGEDTEKIKKQIASLKPLREMLDPEQKKKFDLITKILTEE